MWIQIRGFVKYLTYVFTVISAFGFLMGFVNGVQENSSNIVNLALFLIVWYVYAVATESILKGISRILHMIGIPAFIIIFCISVVGIIS